MHNAAHTVPTRIPSPVHEFSQLFSSTRRGARLARLMGVQRLADWGWPYDSEISRVAALVIGELTANAALHGRAPAGRLAGRDFRLRLMIGPGLVLPRTLRVEVADGRGERVPRGLGDTTAVRAVPGADDEGGRGLLLVETLASRWGVVARPPSGKTVWAECDLFPTHPR
ncbi:ATP-binding protein [Streptomyces sp. NBC_01795]|uniref:ATP-binding protein n=1 Tax=unclassified Streptomyces TaxID=2593676 RepID=UPI002DDB9ABE|nr:MULTISPECIES: ATP-binding protein [unclassified Streptomyces]WSA92155.1 ATP-binding protein [Streptomyces sp. NBC_01795]WSB76520.1 ATP-binding protein [Streptomyces sp. NBC_01775]WSS15191.1 ATP-binding protein [Streptomyces sp. NBC_01186]